MRLLGYHWPNYLQLKVLHRRLVTAVHDIVAKQERVQRDRGTWDMVFQVK